MNQDFYLIQVLEGLNSSVLQKMSSPQNMMLTDKMINFKLFESEKEALAFVEGLKRTYKDNKNLKFRVVHGNLEVQI